MKLALLPISLLLIAATAPAGCGSDNPDTGGDPGSQEPGTISMPLRVAASGFSEVCLTGDLEFTRTLSDSSTEQVTVTLDNEDCTNPAADIPLLPGDYTFDSSSLVCMVLDTDTNTWGEIPEGPSGQPYQGCSVFNFIPTSFTMTSSQLTDIEIEILLLFSTMQIIAGGQEVGVAEITLREPVQDYLDLCAGAECDGASNACILDGGVEVCAPLCDLADLGDDCPDGVTTCSALANSAQVSDPSADTLYVCL